MNTSPRNSIRHLRLARALAGTDLEGLSLIEEIGSIAKLASHYTEDRYGDSGSGPDMNVIEDAFRTISGHSKSASKHCAAVTEAAQAFIHEMELPEFDSDIEDDEEDCEESDDQDADEETQSGSPSTKASPSRKR
jgi:CxxC motif-containing protein (DUF1111 family)